jgi:stage V sporulation protein SpoVS
MTTSKKSVAGAIALVMRDGKVIYHEAFGYDNVDTKTKLSKDAIVRIALQTEGGYLGVYPFFNV